jgi:hypothetical protein
MNTTSTPRTPTSTPTPRNTPTLPLTPEQRAAVRLLVEAFLEDWDRREWLADHAPWASEEHDAARVHYDGLRAELLEALVEGERLDSAASGQLLAAMERLQGAIHLLDGQVLPDDGDYPVEGTIDPGERAERLERDGAVLAKAHAEGWDCVEGWDAYLDEDGALVMNWWRTARGNRHQRDLWVVVDSHYGETLRDDEDDRLAELLEAAEAADDEARADYIRSALDGDEEARADLLG